MAERSRPDSASLAKKKEVRRRILRRVNGAVLREVAELHTSRMVGTELRSRLRASEGLELEGFSPFDVEHSTSRIDFGSLTTLPELLPLAILNEAVNMADYHPQADEHLHIFLDTGKRMRYPLSHLYNDSPLDNRFDHWPQTGTDACWPKPSLLKLMAGVILKAAIDTGFTVRLIEFNERGLVEHRPLRRRCDLTWLCSTIDQSLQAHSDPRAQRQGREVGGAYYQAMASRLLSCRGSAVILGDFMAGADSSDRDPCTKMLNLLRRRAQSRPLIVIRINHFNEVLDEKDVSTEDRGIDHPFGDETYGPRPGHLDRYARRLRRDTTHFEGIEPVLSRLKQQAGWARILADRLRSSCRGYIEIDDRDATSHMLKQIYQRSWTSIRRR